MRATQVTQRGLRLDQAAAVWHVLTSARTVEVITGPAGTGKTRVLAAGALAWTGQPWAGVRHRDIAERRQRAPQRRCPGIGEHHQAPGRHHQHPARAR